MLNLNLSTILLQMANFFILVFILYRFLFRPLQNAMKKRADKITSAMDDAEKAQKEALAAKQEYDEKTNNIDAEIAARKNEARIVIEQTRQQMLSEVQEQADRIKNQTEETLTSLRAEAVQQHKEDIANLVGQFASEMMTDLMDPKLLNLYQEEFLDKIQSIDLAKFVENAQPNEELYIKTIMAEEPDQSFQDRLLAYLKDQIDNRFNLSFEVDEKLIAGGVLRFENELIDGSLSGQINKLKKQYQENA
ncbi:F0F1 ATP synthase subunit delta [bacterium]|nr:F0F1 ATP synthase subunit delta [bacterium]